MKFNKSKLLSDMEKFYTNNLGIQMPDSVKNGFNIVITFIETDTRWNDINQIAYFLATIGHETAWNFRPIKEIRGKKGTNIWRVQNKYWDSGFFGRGYCQITWERNYKRFSEILHRDIVKDPDLALDPTVAYAIASTGMLYGIFTGKKLSDYIKPQLIDFKNARRVVNGIDRAEHIANIAIHFSKFLKTSVVKDEVISITETKSQITIGDDKHDDTLTIVKHIPEKINSWKEWIVPTLGSFGLSISALWAKFSQIIQEPKFYWTVGLLVFLSLIFLISNYLLNKLVNDRKEQRAHELTLAELHIRANPNFGNVEVDKDVYL